MDIRERRGMSSSGVVVVLLVLALGVVSLVYVTSSQSSTDQLYSQGQQVSALSSQLQQLASEVSQGKAAANITLPVMNQPPTIRSITETWYLSPSAHQDRFNPTFIVVNQGDTVSLTLIDNDTVAHDLAVGPPYNIIVNATVPGLIDDLTGQTFTTPSRNNSPGVVVSGTPGNVSAKYSFVAKFSGIYEFVCTYHAQVGMIGYLVVLPNAAYTGHPTSTTTQQSPSIASVNILQGAGTNTSSTGFSPPKITVIVGVNNTVTWTNNDVSPHTVTANDGTFSSGNLAPGQSFTFTFTTPGTYMYHCTYHPWMVATVVVKAGS
ncbi:MAG: cupredoxin domain-containing protein [Nitrososphaerota archaeon]|nr:cupredoxin domain-containing protein [Nitrososphaerota archaeon]